MLARLSSKAAEIIDSRSDGHGRQAHIWGAGEGVPVKSPPVYANGPDGEHVVRGAGEIKKVRTAPSGYRENR